MGLEAFFREGWGNGSTTLENKGRRGSFEPNRLFRLIHYYDGVSVAGINFHFDRVGFDSIDCGGTDLGQHGLVMVKQQQKRNHDLRRVPKSPFHYRLDELQS